MAHPSTRAILTRLFPFYPISVSLPTSLQALSGPPHGVSVELERIITFRACSSHRRENSSAQLGSAGLQLQDSSAGRIGNSREKEKRRRRRRTRAWRHAMHACTERPSARRRRTRQKKTLRVCHGPPSVRLRRRVRCDILPRLDSEAPFPRSHFLLQGPASLPSPFAHSQLVSLSVR